MKRYLLITSLCVGPLMAAPPPQLVRLDLQAPQRPFSLRTAAGTEPLIRAQIMNGGSAYAVNGWTGTLYYAASATATQVVAIAATSVASNLVDFQVSASEVAQTGTWFAQVLLSDGTNTVEWSRGTLVIVPSPGSSGAAQTNWGPVMNWDLISSYIGTPPTLTVNATNEADPVALAAIAALSNIGTDTTARAWATAASNLALSASQASTDAIARAWAVAGSNLAASANATGTLAYVMAEAASIDATNALSRNYFVSEASHPHGGGSEKAMLSNGMLRITALESVPIPNKIQLDCESPGNWGPRIVFVEINGITSVLAHAVSSTTNLAINSHVIWTAGNDGSGSGLDADSIDGLPPYTLADFQSAITNHLRFLTTAAPPASNTASGSRGEIRTDATNLYLYTGSNKWLRVPGTYSW